MADFQQYYGLDASQIGKEIDIDRAATLCMQLPLGSRVMRESDEKFAWDDSTILLSYIEYHLRSLPVVLFGKKGALEELDPPMQPTNKETKIRKKKQKEAEKGLVDGFQIQPQTPEELKEKYGH